MGGTRTRRLQRLGRSSPTLFLVAGAVLVVYAVFNGLWAWTDLMIQGHGLEIAYVLGFLGLLGLYPPVADRNPLLARIAAVATVLGALGILYVSVSDYLQLLGLTTGELPGWGVLNLLPLVGFLGGYLTFGVAGLRSGVVSRRVGVLLLVPGVIVILMLASIITGHPLLSRFQTVFVVSAGEAMAHLAIGATLRTEAAADADEEAAPEPEPQPVSHD